MNGLLEAVLATLVLAGALPVLAGLYQYAALGFSLFSTNLERASPHYPRTAVLVPAWNEGAVVGLTIDRLLELNFPKERLRVYVVDDASTDATPEICIAKMKQYPGRVFHLRRVAGGEGKAHTLNYGLDVLWKSDWTEAVLIMDADVIYTRDSLAKMSRHLADPGVGAVTAYIKEGSRSPNYVQRFITFEYVTATGASRRAQNVLGFLTCLSGGAQLHSRENLLAIGGKIFSATLAEDTFTTFRTQLAGHRAVFESNAIVYAEEPDGLVGLWKQRVRWARGNVQITSVFRGLWFNRHAHPGLGSFSMAVLWFSIFLMPLFQIGTSIGLVGLYFMDAPFAWVLFRGYWILAAVVYLVVTLVSFGVDWESCAKSYREGVLFPGVVSLAVIAYTLFPALGSLVAPILALDKTGRLTEALTLLSYAWCSLSMLVAWGAKELETNRRTAVLSPWLLHLAGYGSLLCAVTFAAYLKELTGAGMQWDKTVKTGKVG